MVPIFNHLPKHDKVVGRLLEILEKHYVISKRGTNYIRQYNTLPGKGSEQLHKTFVKQHPRYRLEADLMALTGSKLADCLTGKQDTAEIMSKGSSMSLLEESSHSSPMPSTMTEQLVTFLGAVLAKTKANGNASIQILDVSGDHGGTATMVAQFFSRRQLPIEYTFTDVSPSSVERVKSKLAQYHWMKFHTLRRDEEPPAAMRSHFDIILGMNSLRGTTSTSESLEVFRQLLKHDGFVVLSEVTMIIDWYDIVFGLLDDWWLAQDWAHCLKPVEVWMNAFYEAGFKTCSYSRGSSIESNTQRLLVASQKEIALPPLAQERERYISLGLAQTATPLRP